MSTQSRTGRAATRAIGRPRAVSDVEVKAAVIELCGAYRAPSTSLIISELAGGDGAVTGAFQSAVRQSLERLRSQGELACVLHRGIHRWCLAVADHPDG